jgi:hypothetical protein
MAWWPVMVLGYGYGLVLNLKVADIIIMAGSNVARKMIWTDV